MTKFKVTVFDIPDLKKSCDRLDIALNRYNKVVKAITKQKPLVK